MPAPRRPPTLQGRHVCLRPLREGDAAELTRAAEPLEETFRWFPEPIVAQRPMQAFVDEALTEQAAGRALPFVIETADGARIIGSTRFMAWAPAHRRAEIGATWLAADVRRSAVNTECKRLLLGHGFDVLGLDRIELKTDALNIRSRTAIERIGATPEGVFRRHIVTASGRVRDTAWYSVIREDWPRVRLHLDALLASRALPA